MKIKIVRIIDNVPMLEMVVASTMEEIELGILSPDDAMEIATDIVHNAADWYDTGDSPWKVEVS